MKFLTQIFLASLIIIKIVLGSIFLYWMELDPLFLERNAIAAQEAKGDQEAEGDQGKRKDVVGVEKDHIKAVNEEEIDLQFLLSKKTAHEKEKKYLEKKRAALMALQEEIIKKIVKLTQLRKEIRADISTIRADLNTKKRIEDQKLRHLIKAYSAMKPQKAASLIEKLNMDFTIELLSKMKGDIVGNILTFVNVEKAAKISEALLTDRAN